MVRRPLMPLLLTFMAGIFAGHALPEGGRIFFLPLLFAVIPIVALSLSLPGRLRAIFILLLFFLSGMLLQIRSQRPSAMLPLAQQGQKVTVEGTILGPPQIIEKSARLNVLVQAVFFHGKRMDVRDKIRLTIYRHVPQDLVPGSKIRFPARFRAFNNFQNPGAYDYVRAMQAKGFSCSASVSDGRFILFMGNGSLPFPYRYLEMIRQPLRRFFHRHLSPEDQKLFSALILGERGNMGPALREPFVRTGLGHILAVSGLHIGLVAWVAFFFFRWLLTRSYRLTLAINARKGAALLACVPVVMYACITGLQVSSQRAMIMALVFFGSILLDREKEVWSSLALAALIILVLEPMALFSIGFQLSFAAVAGILWLTAPFLTKKDAPARNEPWAKGLFIHLLRNLTGLVAICLAAQVFLMPLTVYYFHRISPIALFANITTIPLLGFWIIPAGLLSAALLPLSHSLAALLLHIGATGLHIMMAIIRFWAQLPFASFWTVTPNALEIGLFYALMFCIFFLRKWRWIRPALALVCAAVLIDAGYWVYSTNFRQQLRVTFLDVGQGNAALVEFPGGKRMIIDGGGFPGSGFDVGRNVVAPFLWREKIMSVDYLVLSHPQADHMNGLVFLAETFHPKQFWYNGDHPSDAVFRQLMEVLSSRNMNILDPASLPAVRDISGVTIEVLHPDRLTYPSQSSGRPRAVNDRSLVLRLSYRGRSFLFPGDIEHRGEGTLLKRMRGRLRSHVLLSPHHGSRTSNSEEFLSAVAPEICVISCGKKNRFGFPHSSTLQKLRTKKCRVLRTDREGAVQVTVSETGKRDQLRTYRGHWEPVQCW